MSGSSLNGQNAKRGPGQKSPVQKRKSLRVLQGPEKKIGEDEFMAAAIGDVEWLKQSVRGNRGNINYDKNGLAPAHLAAIHGRLDCLRLLIEKFKMDINLPSKTGWRPIHLVISNQTGRRAFQCLTYLLSRDADPSVTNEDQITPMHQAASEGHVQCLKALIEAGAKVNGVDYRGHTPLDLAKLWGHRKCARILAAEEWHQDKDFMAKEMNQLEKLKMQQVLREIEEDQENKVHQEFYGDLAFKDWLQSHGLAPKPTGPLKHQYEEETSKPTSQSSVKKAEERKSPPRESLQKANSIQRPKAAPATNKQVSLVVTEVRKEPKQQQQPHVTPHRHPDTYPKKTPAPEPVPSKQEESEEARVSDTVDARSDWNKSTKIPKKVYTPILKDHYPHDEYSMMPKHAPKRFTRSPTTGQEEDPDRPATPKTPEPKQLGKEVVYKCKHIFDIHKKKHYDEERLPKSELGMHLINDPNSKLFKRGLLSLDADESFYPRSTAPNKQNMNLAEMMQFMERMTKPTHFPPIKGAQYDLHSEQKAC